MEVKPGYKQTEIGMIPEDWDVVPLSSLGTFKNGINKSSDAFGHGSPFVNLLDVFGASSIDSRASLGLINSNIAEQQMYDLREGDVLFIRSSVKPSGVGLTAVVQETLPRTVFSGFLIRFRDQGALCSKFKRHCFYEEGFRKKVISASSVSANTNINQENLKRLLLPLPANKKEQKAIAEALSDVDSLIEQLELLLIKKRRLNLAAKQELLTGKTRLPGFEAKVGYKQTEVGAIPKDWEVASMGSLGVFSKGQGIRKDEAASGDIPCVRYGEIYTFHSDVVRSFNSGISREVAKTSKRLKKGDLLFAGSGETKEEIGKCVAFIGDEEAYVGGDIVILSLYKGSAVFFGYLFNAPIVVRQKASKGQGDAVVHISASSLSSIKIPVPPTTDEQESIAEVLNDMDTGIAMLDTKLRKARQIKQGMMQELLTGRIRLI